MSNKSFTGVLFLPTERVKRKKEDSCLPDTALFLDVSNKGTDGWNALSPSFDHGGIPVPGMPGTFARSVEGIWQGLKRFSMEAENLDWFEKASPTKRRSGTPRGNVLGHVYGSDLIANTADARKLIYLPAYSWMVNNAPKAQAKIKELVELSRIHMVYLYDMEKNSAIEADAPYPHASFVADLIAAELKKSPVAT